MRRYLAEDGLGPLLVKSVGGSAGISMLGMAFTFLLGWQLARGLGAAGYGVYGVAMAVVSVLGVPSQFGLPQLLTREVASANATHDWARLKGVIRWATRVAIASSLVILAMLGACILIAGPGFDSSFGKTMAIGALLVPLIALGAMSAGILRGLLAVVTAQVPDSLLRPGVHSALLAALLLAGITLTPQLAMAAGVASAACALFVGGLLVLRAMPSSASMAGARETPREWMVASMPMALTEGLRVVQGQAAILALGALVSMSQVGQFRVAASLMTLMVFPLSVINLVVAPHISRLSSLGDRQRLGRMLTHAALGMTVAVFCLMLPFIVVGDVLISRVFGAEFGAANPLVLVLALGTLANAAFGVGATTLNMLGHQRQVMRTSFQSALFLCAALWPAISAWGAMGAAVAVTASMLLWSGLLWRDVRRLEAMDIGAWAVTAVVAARTRG